MHSWVGLEAWLAWHSIHRSMMWFLQIAQLSTTMSQDHILTQFHFLGSKRQGAEGSEGCLASEGSIGQCRGLGFRVSFPGES